MSVTYRIPYTATTTSFPNAVMDPEIAFRMKVTDAAAAPLRHVIPTYSHVSFSRLSNDGSFNFNEQQHKNTFPANDAPPVYVLIMYTQHYYNRTSKFPLYKLLTN